MSNCEKMAILIGLGLLFLVRKTDKNAYRYPEVIQKAFFLTHEKGVLEMWFGIIMAGGSGTRFWPLSRELYPKQFLSLDGGSSLLQGTIDRVMPLIPQERLWIMVGPKHEAETRRVLRLAEREGLPAKVFVEPQSKNTLTPLAVAAACLARTDPEAVLAVMASDHLIAPQEKFLALLKQACSIAEKQDVILTFGVLPTRPETGFGYIELGEVVRDESAGLSPVFRVKNFVEKPDRERAESYIAGKRHLWNSGMLAFRARVFLDELLQHQPEFHKTLRAYADAIGTKEENSLLKELYAKAPQTSVDYGLLEKSKNVWTISADLDWKDVGSWSALDDIAEKDESGNILRGNVVSLHNRNCILYGDKRILATIGLKDLVIVDTDDATLVCHKDEAQKVRDVVNELKNRNRVEAQEHRTTHRPWGHYTILDQGPNYKIKNVTVNPRARLSYQMHLHRSEHWVVIAGTARITLEDQEIFLHVNQSIDIPKTTRHRIENPGKVPLVIIEVQNGEYLEEDDIIRFSDDYQRQTEETRTGPAAGEKS
jgi:mannose-1-phosphate guanylyltransferase/mannose-6-phosphate isomerase